MRFWYNIVFTIFFLLSAPYYFLRMRRRGAWQQGFRQRFGQFDSKLKMALTNRHVLWIHAVSVGEVNIATQLISAIETRLPNIKIVVSTTTSTGMGELRKRLPSHIEKIYFPIDFRKYVSRALRIISPEAIVLVEAEIWPNFLWSARARGIPTFLVNARLSDRSFRGYRRFGFLFRSVFRSFAGVGVQNEADAARLIKLGSRPEAVHVVGNLKFDGVELNERPAIEVPGMLHRIGVDPKRPLLVAGSTHAGEEALLGRVYQKLRHDFPELFLIVVPRHFERGNEAAKDLQAQGLRVTFRTEVSGSTHMKPGETDALLVNTTGELRAFYREAALVFVGKSLCGEGGQNPIEPAALGKPILFGPNMQNFASITQIILAASGAVQVADEAALELALRELLRDPAKARAIGENAARVVQANKGSIERTVDLIARHLKNEEVYVDPRY